MKKIFQFVLPAFAAAALLVSSPAMSQGNSHRGGNGNGRGNGGGGRQGGQIHSGGQNRGGSISRDRGSFETSRPARTLGNPGQSQGNNRSYDRSSRPGNSGGVFQSPSRQRTVTPDQRDRVFRNDSRNNNYGTRTPSPNRGYTYGNRNYGSNRGGYYNQPSRRYSPPVRWNYRYPYRGQTFSHLSVGFYTVPFGGFNYYYHSGIFYRPYGSIYRVVAPPIGISINILPFGYTRFYVGPHQYYYYGGTYYLPRNNGYVVVDPPLGAKLPALPSTAREVFINGQRLFEDDGTYYMEEYNINNQRLYTVVGVHGELNQDQVNIIQQGPVNSPSGYVGVVSVLPADSRKVVINGQDFYLTPDDIYYQEITDGNTVSYQEVGR